jgi:hypothetical protein
MIRNTTKAIKKVSRYLIPAVIGLGVALPCLSVNAAQGVRATKTYMFVVSFKDGSPKTDIASGKAFFDITSPSFMGTFTGRQAYVGKDDKGLLQRQFSGSAKIVLGKSKNYHISVTNMSVSVAGLSQPVLCKPVTVNFPSTDNSVSIVVDYLGLQNGKTSQCTVTTKFS